MKITIIIESAKAEVNRSVLVAKSVVDYFCYSDVVEKKYVVLVSNMDCDSCL